MYTPADMRKIEAEQDELRDAAMFVRNTLEDAIERNQVGDFQPMCELMLWKVRTALHNAEGRS